MEEQIKEIEKKIFIIEMADKLSHDDYKRLEELRTELRTLKGE